MCWDGALWNDWKANRKLVKREKSNICEIFRLLTNKVESNILFTFVDCYCHFENYWPNAYVKIILYCFFRLRWHRSRRCYRIFSRKLMHWTIFYLFHIFCFPSYKLSLFHRNLCLESFECQTKLPAEISYKHLNFGLEKQAIIKTRTFDFRNLRSYKSYWRKQLTILMFWSACTNTHTHTYTYTRTHTRTQVRTYDYYSIRMDLEDYVFCQDHPYL